jgi:hypothetical protein
MVYQWMKGYLLGLFPIVFILSIHRKGPSDDNKIFGVSVGFGFAI